MQRLPAYLCQLHVCWCNRLCSLRCCDLTKYTHLRQHNIKRVRTIAQDFCCRRRAAATRACADKVIHWPIPFRLRVDTAGVNLRLLTHIRQLVQLLRHRLSGLLVSVNQQHLREHADKISSHEPGHRYHPAYNAPAIHSGTQGAQKSLGPVSSRRRPADEPVNRVQTM